MSSENYHEPQELLSETTKNLHRAIISLREELEAVDWYQQRAEATNDAELKAILLHNKREEIEHAMMVLEWLRRNDEGFAEHIATYIGAAGPITSIEKDAKSGEGKAGAGTPTSLGVGSLKGAK